MKRILTYIVVVCFAMATVGGNALAVEKKTNKKKVTVQKKAQVKKTSVKATAKSTKGAKKKYDTFIDKNKNGIDDRRENLKSTKTTKGKKKVAKAKKTTTKKTTTTKKSDSKK